MTTSHRPSQHRFTVSHIPLENEGSWRGVSEGMFGHLVQVKSTRAMNKPRDRARPAHGAASDRFRDLQFEEALGVLNQLDSRGDPRFQELSVGLSVGACAGHGTVPFRHVPLLCGSGDCVSDS